MDGTAQSSTKAPVPQPLWVDGKQFKCPVASSIRHFDFLFVVTCTPPRQPSVTAVLEPCSHDVLRGSRAHQPARGHSPFNVIVRLCNAMKCLV